MSVEQTAEHAEGVESLDLGEVLDAVQSDPNLSSMEQETIIRFANDEERETVLTETPAMVRMLLLHPDFSVEEFRVSDEDRFGVRLSPDEYEDGMVTGIKGTIPIGAPTVKSSSRASNAKWKIVSSAVRDNDPRED